MTTAAKSILLTRVEAALECVRPHLRADGGDVELVDITDNFIVQIRWQGACKTCNMTLMTMRAGIEEVVRNQVSEISGIEAVKDNTPQPS